MNEIELKEYLKLQINPPYINYYKEKKSFLIENSFF